MFAGTQHPDLEHFILHISDTHFVGGADLLHGKVDSDANLKRLFRDFAETKARPEAIVFTGDLADTGDADAYRRLRALVEPAAEAIGARVIWVMGNHDIRTPFRRHLLDSDAGEQSVDLVHEINGLRIIALDSTVPGHHHGVITGAQLSWLGDVLATPAPHGTLIALHHPPVPGSGLFDLNDQEALAGVLRDTDVRAILGGHLHFNTFGTFGDTGIPVSVASATCYSLDNAAPAGIMRGRDGAQGFNLVHVFGDRVMHSAVPIGEFSSVYEVTEEQMRLLATDLAATGAPEPPALPEPAAISPSAQGSRLRLGS
ncbi:metallophosphoesterase [Leucobacter sp. wl10]|uniref:metallophosphoesterase n=1 Tax=Leucobacter sp. wl10 TaxID=2304677 RepID=UPI000E5C1C4D|nr:metallophosphoesterase [Leucobacter sp. wl10]RGE19213.1 phosphodiesterase [Leucobacter sp. wl10]